jgi:hypothetical protein
LPQARPIFINHGRRIPSPRPSSNHARLLPKRSPAVVSPGPEISFATASVKRAYQWKHPLTASSSSPASFRLPVQTRRRCVPVGQTCGRDAIGVCLMLRVTSTWKARHVRGTRPSQHGIAIVISRGGQRRDASWKMRGWIHGVASRVVVTSAGGCRTYRL